MKNLLILESPNKVKKVQGYVGKDYLVSASKGHIRNLGTQKEIGIDIDNNFAPTYNVDPNKRNVVNMLKELLKKCDDVVYIATDFDREGEAIGWHIVQVLKVYDPSNIKRLVFKEITQKGLQDALKNPVGLDMNMVHSQQARMVLDKLIGYKVSPVLWKQFNNYKLSAGRVQSVVVKLINERESEIAKFQSSNYYKLTAGFSLDPKKRISALNTECESRLDNVDEISNIIHNTDEETARYFVSDLKKSKTKRKPSPPFTTSSLQQEASNKLGMSPDECMKVAQKLYEAGLITYMRTDSLALSDDSLKALATTIKSKYGDKYHKQTLYNKKKAKGAQEAHEACRPTDLKKENVVGIEGLSSRSNKLYQLIWRRTMACQMSPADVEIKTIKVELDSKACKPKLRESKLNNSKPYTFVGKFEKILFDGFLAVYNYKDTDTDDNDDDNEENTSSSRSSSQLSKMEKLFASLKVGQEVWCNDMEGLEKQTKCPNSRYTEASLVKKLEDLGIGRPSTYATMVTKVQQRGYVEKMTVAPKEKEFQKLGYKYPREITVEKVLQKVDGEKNKMFPTAVGLMITDFLIKDFSKLMDYGFTALVEEQLDEIAAGTKQWYTVVNSVWTYLNPIIDKLAKAISKNKSETGTSTTKKLLGVHPRTQNDIYIMSTRFGWSVMEEVSSTNKKQNRWASLPTNIKPEALTLDKAITLFVWPKKLGNHRGKEIELHKAKNIYLKYDGKNYSLENYCKYLAEQNKSLPKDKQHTIPELDAFTKKECLAAVKYLDEYNQEMNTKRSEKIEFTENKDVVIKNGMYGYYIKYLDQFNIPLPAKWKKDCKNVTYKDCVECIGKFVNKRGLKVKLKEQLEELNKM